VVYIEVLSVNAALSGATRFSVQRPRPVAYRRSPAPSPKSDFSSFYSGHTAAVFGALSAASMAYQYRYGPHVWPWVVTGLVGTAEAATRVAAGRHFYTDVGVGAIVGSAVGIVIPMLHKRNKDSEVTILPQIASDEAQLVFSRKF
jgi:membrane-associated phospholipid phosphatase